MAGKVFYGGHTLEEALNQTHRCRKKLSPKGEELRKIIDGGFDGVQDSVAKLVSCLIGEDLGPVGVPTGAAVILLSNPNQHNYPLNEVIICVDGANDLFRQKNGSQGNHAPLGDVDAWRYATEAEIYAAYGATKPAKKKAKK